MQLHDNRVFTWVLALPLLAASALWLRDHGLARLDPNALNMAFVTVGLILHGTLRRYVDAVANAVKGATGIIVQFPFYGGIMGVMVVTGLAADFSSTLADAASTETLPLLTFLSAGALNLVVPSGGGQWAIQGPIAIETARQLGVPLHKAVMAVAYGDQWTNMLQPFWALPLLGITQIKARDIIGYTALVMLLSGLWFGAALLLW